MEQETKSDTHVPDVGRRKPVAIGLAVLVFFLWAGSYWALHRFVVTPQERGTFGDSFGAINALFSGLAFAGLIYAILLQSAELELQRLELKSTREELSGQREQLEIQNDISKRQEFSVTFFQLLRHSLDLLRSIELEIGDRHNRRVLNGRAALPRLNEKLDETIFNESGPVLAKAIRGQDVLEDETRSAVKAACTKFFAADGSELEPYFAVVLSILAMLRTAAIEADSVYAVLIRKHATPAELPLLFSYLVWLGTPQEAQDCLTYGIFARLEEGSVFMPSPLREVAQMAGQLAG